MITDIFEYHIIVTGFVQGVGYRLFAYQLAQQYGIHGWVKNNYDGSVELLIQGYKSDLDFYIDYLRKGPNYSEVKDILIIEKKSPLNLYESFNIRY